MNSTRSITVGASEERLERLIRERLQPGADKDKIDKRIWDLFGEEWAVMFTDLSGFSRKVAKFGIIHFLQTIFESERLLLPVIEAHDGILLKEEGDSLLVIFRNARKALMSALEMQRVLQAYNRDKPDEEKVLLCVGIGFGMVLRIGDADVFGQEVNAASKLGEDTAKAGEIIITKAVRDALAGSSDGFAFEPLAETPSGVDQAFKILY
jgi:class 3 adenylate cyclase